MKKVKRYIFSIGAPLAVIAPLAVAVSCGDAPKPQGERVVVNHRTEYVEHYVVKDDATSELTVTPVDQVQTVWSIAVSFAAYDKDGNLNAKFADLAEAAKEIAAKVTAANPDEKAVSYQDTIISVAGAKVSLKDIQKIDPTIKLADFKDATKIENIVKNMSTARKVYIDLKGASNKDDLDTFLGGQTINKEILESIGLDASSKKVELIANEAVAATAVKALITTDVATKAADKNDAAWPKKADGSQKTWTEIVNDWVNDKKNVQDANNLTDAEKSAKSVYLIDLAKKLVLNKILDKITDNDQKALFNAVLADEDTLKVFVEKDTVQDITDAFDKIWIKNKKDVLDKKTIPDLLATADTTVQVFNGMHD